jgi:hypothetical protein
LQPADLGSAQRHVRWALRIFYAGKSHFPEQHIFLAVSTPGNLKDFSGN